MKIGILTYHRSHNYGAFLQSYALCMRLRQQKFEVEIIDYNMYKSVRTYGIFRGKNPIKILAKIKMHKMFETNLINAPCSLQNLTTDSNTEFVEFVKGKYDIIIAGSDEIWKLDGFRGFPNPYWLIGDMDCCKISYAASSRSDFSILDYKNKKIAEDALEEFEYIGVRDLNTKTSIENLIYDKSKVHLNCDPTFLYDFAGDAKRGRKLLYEKYKISSEKKIIALMTHDNKLVKIINENYKNDYTIISLHEFHFGMKNLLDLTPFEWIDVIKSVDLIVTGFFHGMCLAIQNNTSFYAVDTNSKTNEESKMFDLLIRENLEDRFILGIEKHDNIKKMILSCDQILKHEKKINFENIVKNQKIYFEDFLQYLNNKNNNLV